MTGTVVRTYAYDLFGNVVNRRPCRQEVTAFSTLLVVEIHVRFLRRTN